jgi:preprotein translocase subunit Sss1
MTNGQRAPTRSSYRKVALVAAVGLLLMAVLGALANFGVLRNLVVPGNAEATFAAISSSEGLFRVGIVAFLVVIALDVVVAWALFFLLRPVNETLALLQAWMRLVYGAVFAGALANLLNAARLLAPEQSGLGPQQLHTQVMSSVAAFGDGWQVGLSIFGLHLLCLGVLFFTSPHLSRLLGVLLAIAGGGYVADALGTILIPGFTPTVALFTFVGEVVLMVWLFARAIKGFGAGSQSEGEQTTQPPVAQPTAVGS